MRGLRGKLKRTNAMAPVKQQSAAKAGSEARHLLPPLPYDFAALEPHIDAQTMQIHHGKHHQTYITNLNNALAKHPELANKSLEELLRGIDTIPDDIRAAVRQRLGVADARERKARSCQPAESGQSLNGQQDSHSRARRLGARLLPQVPEPTTRLRCGVVERGKLAGRRSPLRGRAIGARARPALATEQAELGSDSGC